MVYMSFVRAMLRDVNIIPRYTSRNIERLLIDTLGIGYTFLNVVTGRCADLQVVLYVIRVSIETAVYLLNLMSYGKKS